MKKRKIAFYCVCCLILVSCNNRETGKITKENDETKIEEERKVEKEVKEAREAYIYARNLQIWDSVLNYSKEYREVAEIEIQQPEKIKIYREKEKNADDALKDEVYGYYFMGANTGASLNYSATKKTWGTMFGLVYKADFDELLSKNALEFIGETTVVYPNSYFPESVLTDYKSSCLKKMKDYIKEYMEQYMEKGEYKVAVMDFADADNQTLFMIQNDEGERNVLPMDIIEDTGAEPGLYVEVRANVMTPEFKEDCDLGGIKYSELFSKLSVEKYQMKIP